MIKKKVWKAIAEVIGVEVGVKLIPKKRGDLGGTRDGT